MKGHIEKFIFRLRIEKDNRIFENMRFNPIVVKLNDMEYEQNSDSKKASKKVKLRPKVGIFKKQTKFQG